VDGIEIHTRVQKQRAKVDPLYQAEVAVSSLFERKGFSFRIDGRMDGIYRHDPPKIEEIKTTFSIRDLSHHLSGNPMEHPYCLQLLTYGYFHWRQYQVLPDLSFHLVSSRNNDTDDIKLTLDIPQYEQWLDLRLNELVMEATQAEKRAARRRKVAAGFIFPFETQRPGQIELMQTIEQFMQSRPGKPWRV
jgi:DNA excision repair protein ERCC-2